MVQDIEVLKVNITNFEDNIKHRQEHSETPDVTCPQFNKWMLYDLSNANET
jgi:hypothetical protein